MRYLKDKEKEDASVLFEECRKIATYALCKKDKCGAIIEKNGEVIGSGYNGPPLDEPENCKCAHVYKLTEKPKSDQTCCPHAEWRAIMDALKKNPGKMNGSRIYFSRVSDSGDILPSGKPYCTVCSRLVLDSGIKEFILQNEEGIVAYDTKEYNDISYAFFE